MKIAGMGAGAILLNGCAPESIFGPAIPSPMYLPTLTPFQPSTPTDPPSATSLPSATPSPASTPTAAPTAWTWTLSTPEATGTITPTPDTRKLCFVLWDHQLARYGYKPRNLKMALPETCPLFSGAANRLTADWVDYWRGILRICNPEMGNSAFETAWKSLTMDSRAFTNKSGPESGGFALHSITCGGATHEVVTGEPEGPAGKYIRIYTLNIHDAPPPIPSSPKEINITRHFFGTTGSSTRLSDGSYAVYGFPQFENCIVPLVSPDDTDMIEASRIKMVSNVLRPYNTGS